MYLSIEFPFSLCICVILTTAWQSFLSIAFLTFQDGMSKWETEHFQECSLKDVNSSLKIGFSRWKNSFWGCKYKNIFSSLFWIWIFYGFFINIFLLILLIVVHEFWFQSEDIEAINKLHASMQLSTIGLLCMTWHWERFYSLQLPEWDGYTMI